MGRKRNGFQPLKGGYFFYCQWCRFDGHCILRHNQFLGMKSSGKIDKTPYPGHEDVGWHFIAAQRGTKRGMCHGRIYKTDSIYFPLACECGAVIPSLRFSSIFGIFCAKFQPNEKGKERLRIAQEIAKKKGIKLSEIDFDDLPPPDPNYKAVMSY